MKKTISLFLATTLFFTSTTFAFDRSYDYSSDPTIFGETASNIYVGKTENNDKIQNLRFVDTVGSPYAESIARMGAFDIIKGTSNQYRPNSLVTNQETLAFLVRMAGLEREAMQQAETIRSEDDTLNNVWALGYLNVAMQMGLIEQTEYNQSLSADQASLDPATSFLREAPTTREQLAVWIYDFIMLANPDAFPLDETVQSVLTFNDYGNISVENVQKIEAVTSAGIMEGTTPTTFNPNGTVTRGEMAQILSNIDSYYYDQLGYEEKRGTVAGIQVEIQQDEVDRDARVNIYVRTSTGDVDILQNYYNNDISPQTKSMNVPVYKNGAVYGLQALESDDKIEYVIDTNTNEVLYVQVISSNSPRKQVSGKLLEVDFENGELTIVDRNEIKKVYPIASTIYGDDYIYIDNQKRKIGEIPIGSTVDLIVINNVVMEVQYVGEDVQFKEYRGIVLENNPQLGYMIILDNDGNKINLKYYSNEINVEKQQYYDIDDEVGYIDEVFPSFQYDPRDTVISDIEVGDIVFVKPYEDEPGVIESISATTNYTMKYGQIKQIVPKEDTTNMLVEFENGATSYYEVPNNVPITKNGKMINRNDIQVGDYAKFLVNQAIIAPGYVEESVKEIVVEGSANYVNSIIKGNVVGYDPIQNKLLIDNTRTLVAGQWSNYDGIESFDLNRNVEIYSNGERTNIDYLNRYLREGTAYVAVQNSFTGDEVKKVSVYDGRDQVLNRDTVVESSPSGDFTILNGYQNISTDDGTIVVRHGRLVDNNNIQPYDYGTVVLNGGNHASVVEIVDRPNTGGKMVIRGRVQSVDEGDSFTVQSMVVLEDDEWIYTPVERQFEIDNKTTFLIDGQYMNLDEFLGYTSNTAIDEVYNIVSDGVRAELVTDGSYAKQSITGTVYDVSDNTIYLKDVMYKDEDSNTWDTLSDINNTAVVTTEFNSIVLRNGDLISSTDLKVGEKILVMTPSLPEEKTSGMTVTGTIVTVEKN